MALLSLAERSAHWHPAILLALFLAASFLMIWRLEGMMKAGVEGTVLGTLVMPYCSGIGNLVFAWVVANSNADSGEVITNCLVNNVTNLTLLIGLPTLLWGAPLLGGKAARTRISRKGETEQRLNRLSLLLTLTAVLFFSGAVWALARDGRLDFADGLVLVGLFLFWQCFHVFDVLKSNVRGNRSFSPRLILDLALLGIGAWATYLSVNGLVQWVGGIETGFFRAGNLGWLSGCLMVVPNALLALYYGWKRRPDIIYSSQVGDGHICIPLCIGIAACYTPITVPSITDPGLLILAASAIVHFALVLAFRNPPRLAGILLTLIYTLFVYRGWIG
ncbi:MAG TPA: sodium:calcium symporter [Methylomirabilota bacterium]|nr:sodium:calcium symporter [Methylomirabilota bacterium]